MPSPTSWGIVFWVGWTPASGKGADGITPHYEVGKFEIEFSSQVRVRSKWMSTNGRIYSSTFFIEMQ